MENRETRYQGAIIKDNSILLIRHLEHRNGRTYWLFPGGGIERGETEEECVKREIKEETNLDVKVVLLLDVEAVSFPPELTGLVNKIYQNHKTYLCEVISGEASPGLEPEPEAVANYTIAEVRWFDLLDVTSWGADVHNDSLIFLPLERIRKKLGFLRFSPSQK